MAGIQFKAHFAEEAKVRQSEAGGDHGNQYTGGKGVEIIPPLETGKSRDKVALVAMLP